MDISPEFHLWARAEAHTEVKAINILVYLTKVIFWPLFAPSIRTLEGRLI